jgi:hypothetical protein
MGDEGPGLGERLKNCLKSRWCRPFFISFASPNRKFYNIVGLGVPVEGDEPWGR